MMRFFVFITALISLLPLMAHAEQWAFKRIPANDETVFLYGYRNSFGDARQLSFELNNELINKSDNALLSVNQVRKISDMQALEGMQELSVESRHIIEREYDALYNRMLKKADDVNRQLSPFYEINLTRSGETEFGIKQVAENSAGVYYFWKIPSVDLKINAIADMNAIFTDIVEAKNAELDGKVSLSLTLKGNNTGLGYQANNAAYNQLGRDAFDAVQQEIAQQLKQQSRAGNISQKYLQEIVASLNEGLQKLELSAEIELAKFQKQYRILRNQSLKDYYLLLSKQQGGYAIRVDYHAVVDQHRAEMLPVMQGVVNDAPTDSDLRVHIENALNFVQSIPYDTLEKRDLNGLSGFLLPPSMIVQNRGDCDTKSAALLAMLSHIMPESLNGYPLIMVLIEGHAFIGANIKPRGDDTVHQYKGSDYVMMEVAGPGLFPVGKLAAQSAQALAQNKIIEIIPIKATL
ncbi:MAG: hypothetical protein K0U45_04405 [Alphaproteobacteria bacterium]|nr:hypothetical protein [Alphaproteobacteria bacterium]